MADSRTLKLSVLADVDDLKKNLNIGSKEVDGFGTKVADFGKKAAVAFAAAAAAAAAYAGKLAIEGVKAAVADEAAQESLRKTLENVTGATDDQVAAVEEYITATTRQIAVSDEELRPSLDRLVRATGDVEKAQNLQNLALDIAAGTGKSLQTVTEALSKAQEGNLSGLTRLGVGISATEAKTLSLDEITNQLSETFKGQAETQSATFQGRIEKLGIAFDEAKESLGAALLPVLETFLTLVTDKILPIVQKFTDGFSMDTGLGSNIKKVVEILKTVAAPVWDGLVSAFDKIKTAVEGNKDTFDKFAELIKKVAPVIGTVLGKALSGVGTIVSGIITIIGKAVSAVISLVNGAIKGINLIIKGYNAIPGLPDIKTIGTIEAPKAATIATPASPSIRANERAMSVPSPSSSNVAAKTPVTNNITVNGAIDSESTARQIVKVLNEAATRGTGGGSGIYGMRVAL